MSDKNSKCSASVIQLFEAQAARTPLYPAVIDSALTRNYQSINEKANQIAYWLNTHTIKPGEHVGVLLDPGVDYITCILAILKTGAVYVPLDSLAPKQRLNELVQDASPSLIITNEHYLPFLNTEETSVCLMKQLHLESATFPRANPNPQCLYSTPLYMMYTSGSTGTPKGVLISQEAVINLVKTDNYAKVQEQERIGQLSNCAFDGSTFEIWSALLNGATLTIIPPDVRADHNQLKTFLLTHDIHHLFLPTGLFHQLIKSAVDTLDPVKTLIFGGEQVNVSLLKWLQQHRVASNIPVTLINGYGPTEATTFTCRHIMNEHSTMDDNELGCIGTPINNVRTYILDEQLNSVTEGELYISGINLALHYHNCPSQNEKKFLTNPFEKSAPFTRMYKTGDKVRLLKSGKIQFLGRLDDQVKIGGFRIHLSEVEQALMQHPDISLAAVQVDIGGGAHHMLTAYIVSSNDAVLHADDIRQFLSRRLPTYMLPAKYVQVEEFPLNRVGKVDRSKLTDVAHVDLTFHIDTLHKRSIEEKITQVWRHLLNRKTIDTHKNLFELGANSLLITEACYKINEALNSELQVSSILTYPTIYKLSRYLEGDLTVNHAKKRKAVSSSEIAIIGMACRFPNAESLDEYWQNLCEGKDCLTRFTDKELVTHPTNQLENPHFVPVRGILKNIEQFDASFFGFNPQDARNTDPQHRIFLECTWEALEHAGVAPQKQDQKKISVFAGMTDSTYLHENLLKNIKFCTEHDRFQSRIASSTSMLSTQVSYRLNLQGRSLNINTACSTGLVVVEQACKELISGHSDVAIAGAVAIVTPQAQGYIYQTGSIESPDGQCRPFAANANGTVFSNGVGVVVLKRLEDALVDNDTIYAIIKGSGTNNDGADKLGFTAPSTNGQAACIREALETSEIDAEQLGYIEAHGTATSLGDAIEIEALSSVFQEQNTRQQFCYLGSVKGNIGHTDVTAGIAGLIKTALCLYHQKIPPTLHFQQPNPQLALESSPFLINTQLVDWSSSSKRFAGVSSFGVGGTNVHMILSEHCQQHQKPQVKQNHLFILSAKSEKALTERTSQLNHHLSRYPLHNLSHIAHTLQIGREDFPWRSFSIGNTTKEIKMHFDSNQIHRCQDQEPGDIVFMFPGQGMQYHQMASQLIAEFPVFSQYIMEGVSYAKPYLQCNILELINNPEDKRLTQTQYAQAALFIVEYALAQLLIECGIRPHALIGHSVGEYVAACVAGVFSFAEGVALVCQRGLLMASVPKGAMIAIECNVEQTNQLEQAIPGIELALHNGQKHCVMSGDLLAIDALEAHLASHSIPYQRLAVSHAFHSKAMENIEHPFKELFSTLTLSDATIPIVSNVTGNWLSTEEIISSDYWYRHLRSTVQLYQGLQTVTENDPQLFIEIGPGRSLLTFLNEVLKNKPHKAYCLVQPLPNQHKATTETHQLLNAIGTCWQHGIPIQWEYLNTSGSKQRVALPTYPFQRQSYWLEPDSGTIGQIGQPKLYHPVWNRQLNHPTNLSSHHTELNNHSWILFQDKHHLSTHWLDALQKAKVDLIVIKSNPEFIAHSTHSFSMDPGCKEHWIQLFHRIKDTLQQPILIHACSFSPAKGELLDAQIDLQLNNGFYSLLHLAQACIKVLNPKITLKCAVLTNGTQYVLGTEQINPINATLLGAIRVINQECSAFACRIFDIGDEHSVSALSNLASQVIATCLTDIWEDTDVIAYRNGYPWDLSYTPVKSSPQLKNLPLKDKGIYFITGGLGAIAFSICEVITQHVNNPTFILVSRQSIPHESSWSDIVKDDTHRLYQKINQLVTLKKLGARIHCHSVDVTHGNELTTLINEVVEKHGIINGLIHCAGIAGNGLIHFKTDKKAQDVLAPKVHGTYYLAHALRQIPLDFVILMSSIAAITGEQGQVDYCAANAALDAFVNSSLFLSQHVISLNWNTWRDIGMAVDNHASADVSFLNRGNDISPKQGKRVFIDALSLPYSNLICSNLPIDEYQKLVRATHIIKEQALSELPRDELNITNQYVSSTNSIEEQLIQLWQNALGIEPIGIEDDFFSLGGHSLKALRLIDRINQHFHTDLPMNQLYRTPTISELSSIISSTDSNLFFEMSVTLKKASPKIKNSATLFVCHPISGMIYCFNSLVEKAPSFLSIYGLQDPQLATKQIIFPDLISMAQAYTHAIQTIQPDGPYHLLGYSFGGSLLYEVAALLQHQKKTIGLLGLIDSWAVFSSKQHNERHFKSILMSSHPELPSGLIELSWERMNILLAHQFTRTNQKIHLFKANELLKEYQEINDPTNGWSSATSGEIICHNLNANHETIINAEHSQLILELIQNYISPFANGDI